MVNCTAVFHIPITGLRNISGHHFAFLHGYDDGTFHPNATVTRAGVATIVDHMLGRSADESFVDDHAGELVHFSDLKDSYRAYYNIMEATNAHTYRQNDAVEDWKALQ